MATPSLSPKRQAERMQRFQSAVRTIAFLKAKKAVQAQIRARGERISDYSCRDISVLANAHLAQHQEELISKATAVVLTFREFAEARGEALVDIARSYAVSHSTISRLTVS